MYNGCTKLESAVLNGCAYAVSIADCQFNATAINAFLTGLATVTTKQTVTITNNPGSLTCDASIATKKGWTVVGRPTMEFKKEVTNSSTIKFKKAM